MDTLFGVEIGRVMWVLLAVFGVGALVLVFSALRNRVAFKMAARNIPRRKTQSVLVVFGLMLATLLFSASFTIGDTLTNSIRAQALEFVGETDVIVAADAPEGEAQFAPSEAKYFDESVAGDVRDRLSDEEQVEGVAPLVTETVPVVSESSDLSEPAVDVLGMKSGAMDGFDRLTTASEATLSVDDLAKNEVYLSDEAASRLDVGAGDTVQTFLGERPTEFEVAGVYAGGGNPSFAETSMVAPLERLQELTGNEGGINNVIITHVGPPVEGGARSGETVSAIEPVLENNDLEAQTVKKEFLEQADEAGTIFSSIFLVLGQFSVVAGILLIFLIFVMLAAERKRELGIARGIGMQRGHLIRMFSFEGALYAVVASAIGSVLGVGVGWLMALVFGQALAQFDEGTAFDITFSLNPANVVIAFTLGMVLTFAVVFLSAWRVSRMNVVRAIRDIPEPDKKGRGVWGVLLAILTPLAGVLATWQGLEGEQTGLYLTGLSLLIVGVALLARVFRLPDRVAFTLAGVGLLALWLLPVDLPPESMPEGGIEMFFISGVMVVIGGVWVVIYNADLILAAVVAVFGRIRGLPPVLKTAVSYPLQSRFRTGMTLAMISLIVFTIVTTSFLTKATAGVYEETDQFSGGFDVRADAGSPIPIPDMENALGNVEGVSENDVSAVGTVTGLPTEVKQRGTDRKPKDLLVQGVDGGYTKNAGYGFDLTAPGYGSAEEVWTALREESDVAVISSSLAPTRENNSLGGPGPPVKLSGFYLDDDALPDDLYLQVENPGSGESRDLRVIGVLEQTAYYPSGSILTSGKTIGSLAGGPAPPQSYLFDLEPGTNAGATARALEEGFVQSGLQTTVLAEEIQNEAAANTILNNLLTGFMALGLLVGIAALGVIAARSVVERRQQIGMLRALGFQKGQVRFAFLLESSFIALMGITLGVALGAALSYGLVSTFSEDLSAATYQVPWAVLALVVGLAYAASLLTTYLPARQASQVYPAEALRYEE